MRMKTSWLGKMIGSFAGLVLTGHWAGVLMGIFLGHAYDQYRNLAQFANDLGQIRRGGTGPDGQQKALQSGFLQTLFLVLGKLAKCDGSVSPSEIRWAEELMQRLYLSAQQRKEAIDWFNQGKQPHLDISPLLEDFAQFAVPFGLNQMFLELMVECALCDGELHEQERGLLLLCVEKLKLPRGRLEELILRHGAGSAETKRRRQGAGGRAYHYANRQHDSDRPHFGGASYTDRVVTMDLQRAYQNLGVTPQASRSEVKRAYRRLMSQHHPDKLVSKGVPEAMLNLAKEKTQTVQKSYELICKNRGFR